MSMRRPGQHPDELISAAISGDISEREQAQLDAHLDTCESCRQTMAAWAEQRRMVATMRQAPVPRDLGPRIRAGIESGAFAVPWWRRTGLLVGSVAGLATVAAALVAVAVISGLLPRNQVASTGSPIASASGIASAAPTGAPTDAPATPTAEPTPRLPQAMLIPAARFKYELTDGTSSLELADPAEGRAIPVDESAFPIDAATSPNGMWTAFSLQGDGSGLVSSYAFSTDNELVRLTNRGQYSPFARFTWSPSGTLLAYTALDVSGNADVWVLNVGTANPKPARLTNTGRSFVGSFVDDTHLFVSSAANGEPVSYEVEISSDGQIGKATDPASIAQQTYPGVFLPVDNREGAGQAGAVAYWRGEMALEGESWLFTRGGMLYWHDTTSGNAFDDSDPQVFDTLQIQPGGAAFESAKFDWGPDGDGFAVWEARWTGIDEGDGFPDEGRAYFGHLASGLHISSDQALDPADTQGIRVVDVALGGAQYLGITVVTESGAEGGSYGPTAELRLVTRHTGDVADTIEKIGQNRVWNGPPIYPAVVAP